MIVKKEKSSQSLVAHTGGRRVADRYLYLGQGCAGPEYCQCICPTDLLVKVKVCQWKLDGFSDLLLLHVQPSNISIGNVRLFVCAQHSNGRICFRWKNIDKGIRMAMESDR